jgi:hypothetical protein
MHEWLVILKSMTLTYSMCISMLVNMILKVHSIGNALLLWHCVLFCIFIEPSSFIPQNNLLLVMTALKSWTWSMNYGKCSNWIVVLLVPCCSFLSTSCVMFANTLSFGLQIRKIYQLFTKWLLILYIVDPFLQLLHLNSHHNKICPGILLCDSNRKGEDGSKLFFSWYILHTWYKFCSSVVFDWLIMLVLNDKLQ